MAAAPRNPPGWASITSQHPRSRHPGRGGCYPGSARCGGTGHPAGILAARCLAGEGWLGALFYVLFILPRETEEFSVQESRVLAPLPRRMKAAEQTGENQRRLRPAGFPHRRPRCQLLHKAPARPSAAHGAFFLVNQAAAPAKPLWDPAANGTPRGRPLSPLLASVRCEPWAAPRCTTMLHSAGRWHGRA